MHQQVVNEFRLGTHARVPNAGGDPLVSVEHPQEVDEVRLGDQTEVLHHRFFISVLRQNMKYWGRALIVYLGITAALYGTHLVQTSTALTTTPSTQGPVQSQPQRAEFGVLPGRLGNLN